MKATCGFGLAILFVSTHAASIGEPVAQIQFTGATNDLMPGIRMPQTTTEVYEARGTTTRTVFPLSYSVSCDAEKKDCKHAVIRTVLEVRYTADKKGGLWIMGTLKSEMGRSLSNSGLGLSETMSVADSVPIIGTSANEKPINVVLAKGQEITLSGLGGASVRVSAM